MLNIIISPASGSSFQSQENLFRAVKKKIGQDYPGGVEMIE